jgi:hypothetical protein
MKELQLIFKTREGVSLYFDGAAFHTENIEMVKKALTVDLKSNDRFAACMAKDLLRQLDTYPVIKEVIYVA